eukprot:jgi/Antlo1/42/1000
MYESATSVYRAGFIFATPSSLTQVRKKLTYTKTLRHVSIGGTFILCSNIIQAILIIVLRSSHLGSSPVFLGIGGNFQKTN